MIDPSTDMTRLLQAVSAGEEGASARLYDAVYAELREMARRAMARERPGHTLEPTALVHEAHLRLVKDEGARWESRAHFFAAAAEAMRRILVESARARGRLKRGGGRDRVDLDEAITLDGPRSIDLIALDEALAGLEARDARKAQVVKHRYFLGLTVKETADLLDVSPRTVDDDWDFARAWLRREVAGGALQNEIRRPEAERTAARQGARTKTHTENTTSPSDAASRPYRQARSDAGSRCSRPKPGGHSATRPKGDSALSGGPGDGP